MPRTDKVPLKALKIGAPNSKQIAICLRLLDARQEEADWKDAAGTILGLEVNANPEEARSQYETALKQALWLRDHGFASLAKQATE